MYTLMLDKRNKLIVKKRKLKKTNKQSIAYLLTKMQLLFLRYKLNLYIWYWSMLQTKKTHIVNNKIKLYRRDGSQMKTIFVNISNLVRSDAKTGIQRVGRSVLQELLIEPPHGYRIAPIYFNYSSKTFCYAQSWLRRNYILDDDMGSNGKVIFARGDVFLDVDLDYDLVKYVEFERSLEWARNNGCKICFVVYDLLPIQMPQYFDTGFLQKHEAWLKKVMQFDVIACISQTVTQELHSWAQKAIAIHKDITIGSFQLGMDIENSNPTYGFPPNAEKVIESLKLRKTFLMVGTIEGRKGHEQVLRAFDLLWAKGMEINLCLVGKEGWLVEQLMDKIRLHPALWNQLFWLEGASDEYLDRIYKVSTALIAASYGEGYGLPIMEAARHGIPIIARDIPVFREVTQGNAFYFQAQSPEELADDIQQWLKLFDFDKNSECLSSATIQKITWAESTKQLLKIIDV